ncbi:MAG TPA: ATP-binding protein [Streptosporangiaceae bacterium]|jgi:serine/threonine-protein kinase RsbW
MKFSLALPRESLSIPVIRRVLGDALRGLGVSEDCIADILVATCEACTNVVKHAETTSRYEVLASVDDDRCVLKIVDKGQGLGDAFGRESTRTADPRPEAESGRGIKIMRALVDDVTFDTGPERGTVVYLEKRLTWRDEALLRRLEYDLVHSGR